MNRKPALVVHPDDEFRHRIRRMLSDLGCEVETGVDGALRPERTHPSDYRLAAVHEEMVMSDGEKIAIHFWINAGDIPVIVFSDRIDVRKAVAAVQEGAFDYFTKDSDDREIQTSIARAVKLSGKDGRPENGTPGSNKHGDIISRSDQMARLLAIAERVAQSNATVHHLHVAAGSFSEASFHRQEDDVRGPAPVRGHRSGR